MTNGYQDYYDLQSKDLLKYKKSQIKKPFLRKIVRKANPVKKRIPAENGIDFYTNQESYQICRLLGANSIIPKGVNMRYIAKNIIQSPNTNNQPNNYRLKNQIRTSQESTIRRSSAYRSRPGSNSNQ